MKTAENRFDSRAMLLERASAAIQEAWEAGCPIAQNVDLIAPIAVRRWQSSVRRGVDQSDLQARVNDLAKGLSARLEKEPKLVGPLIKDYRYLARKIVERLDNPQNWVSET